MAVAVSAVERVGGLVEAVEVEGLAGAAAG